jgi:uncharacterized membrane protein YhaH (DUF805 family)
MKKELISPLLTILAMILLIMSRIIDAQKMDWLEYVALVIIIASIIYIIKPIKSSKLPQIIYLVTV